MAPRMLCRIMFFFFDDPKKMFFFQIFDESQILPDLPESALTKS